MNTSYLPKIRALLLCAGLLCAGFMSTGARATPIPASQTIDELMVNQMEGELSLFEHVYGKDPIPLDFSTDVNVAAGTYSYVLDAGTTYSGLAMSYSGSGAYDFGTGVLNGTASGALGSDLFSISTTGLLADAVDGVSGQLSQDFLGDSKGKPRKPKSKTKVHFKGDGTSTYETTVTDEDGGVTTYDGTDTWTDTQTDIIPGRTGSHRKIIYDPPSGGNGAGRATTTEVPEPDTLLLLVGGMLALVGTRSRFSTR